MESQLSPMFMPCVLIPTYDNPRTVAGVVRVALGHVDRVVLVDDGSGPAARAVLDDLQLEPRVTVVRRERNGGKGAAMKIGLRVAVILGCTHAMQVDADGQHDLDRIPAFLEAARQNPDALILGYPLFDDTAPSARVLGRRIAQWWVNFELGAPVITDPMIGFRVYPLLRTVAVRPLGDRMQADIELAVRMAWMGTLVVNLPVGVRYLTPEEGGVSHFRMLRDNAAISWMHTRLVTRSLIRRALGVPSLRA